MRRVVYSVAMSLDGYIAGPGGEYDWIPEEPGVDWGAFMARFDTVLMGRRTWELVASQGPGAAPALPTFVFSTTLWDVGDERVTVVRRDAAKLVRRLRERDGADIWLMGGGVLFRELLDAGLVDRIEVAVVPVLLGDGVPMLPEWEGRARLTLEDVAQYRSGIVLLTYDVAGLEGAPAP